MFYVAAPLALLGCLIATVAALVLLPDLWRSAVALALAVVAAFLTYSPGTSDGPHAVMFGAYAVALLFAAGNAAQRVRRSSPGTSARYSTSRHAASGLLVVSRTLMLALIGIGVVLAVVILIVVSGSEP